MFLHSVSDIMLDVNLDFDQKFCQTQQYIRTCPLNNNNEMHIPRGIAMNPLHVDMCLLLPSKSNS